MPRLLGLFEPFMRELVQMHYLKDVPRGAAGAIRA
jgi:hypothetical protein